MNLIIQRLDGTEYKTSDYNMKIIDFVVNSPAPLTTFESIEGRSGLIDLGTVYDARILSALIQFYSIDGADYPLFRNKIFRIFDSLESFYLIDDREPYKRWLVKCNNSFTPNQKMATFGELEISFISSSPYVESTFTTLFPSEHGQMLQVASQDFNDPPIKYSFDTDTFFIWNAGDIAIDPREHYLKIELYCDATDLTITNLTNGSKWKLYGDLYMYETVTIEGIRTTKNGVSVFKDTNKKILKLNKGWNQFQVTGVTSLSMNISFDFRFYYY